MKQSQHNGPESRLGISFSEPGDGTLHWYQPIGGQFLDPCGRFATGGLAVLVDSGLGAENHRRRASGMWTVTTELRIDLLSRPDAGAKGLEVRTDHLGSDGHCLITRGEVFADDGGVVAAGLVKTVGIPGAIDEERHDEEPPWPAALESGSLAEVLCVTLNPRDDGPGGTRAVEAVVAPEPALANPLGNLHGGVFAAVADIAGAAVFPHEREVSSSSLDVRYIRQIPLASPVTVRAEVLHDGRSWGIAQATTLDERGRVCAVASVTVYGRR